MKGPCNPTELAGLSQAAAREASCSVTSSCLLGQSELTVQLYIATYKLHLIQNIPPHFCEKKKLFICCFYFLVEIVFIKSY